MLTLAAAGGHSLTPKDCSDMLVARALIQLGLVSRERLNAWITQEAIEVLQGLLAWSEREVSFVEGVQAPTDRVSLSNRITSLISSLASAKPLHGSLIKGPHR